MKRGLDFNSFLKREEKDIKDIFNRFQKKDFSGREGTELRNSFFVMMTSISGRIGALIFMIILARLLVPELFGLYSIALSVIIIFSLFSDLGISTTAIEFISKELNKGNKKKAKAYAKYFLKRKLVLTFIMSFVLALIAEILSKDILGKPIFFGLLAGAFLVFLLGILGIFEFLLMSMNKFKRVFWKELLFQISRIILVPIFVIFGINYFESHDMQLSFIIFGLIGACLISIAVLYFLSRKKFDFFKYEESEITKKDKKKIRKFLFAMPAIAVSGLFFGELDILILGYFIFSEFVGYYRAAFGVTEGLIGLIAFSIALLPVFSGLSKKEIEKDFRKFLGITFVLSVFVMLIVLVFAPLIISIIYGSNYMISSTLLRIFSLVILSAPLIAIYEIYFVSRGKPEVIAKILLISTMINVVLTFYLIRLFLNYGQIHAVYGAIIASIASRYIVLAGLVFVKKKYS